MVISQKRTANYFVPVRLICYYRTELLISQALTQPGGHAGFRMLYMLSNPPQPSKPLQPPTVQLPYSDY